jgi:hypothetical protein
VSLASGTPHSLQSVLRLPSVQTSAEVFIHLNQSQTHRQHCLPPKYTNKSLPHGVETPKITAMLLIVIREQTVECVSQAISQRVSHAGNQSASQSVTQAVSQIDIQPVRQSVSQSDSQAISHAGNQSDR